MQGILRLQGPWSVRSDYPAPLHLLTCPPSRPSGLDYEVQRQTSTFRPSRDYRLASPGPKASGIRRSAGVAPGSPLDDLLNHVNSLLKVRGRSQGPVPG